MTLVAYYPLQEDSGDAIDASGNGNTGTVNGATQGVEGLLGKNAYSFDGSDDYVSLPDLNLTSSQSFTFSAWANASNLSSTGLILGRFDGTDDIITFGLRSDNAVEFRMGHAGGNEIVLDSAGEASTNQWYHLGGVYDATGPSATLYQDGSEIDSGSGTVDDFSVSNGPDIGRRSDNSTYHDGRLSNIRVYDRALTPGEIQYLYDRVQTAEHVTSFKSV